MFASTNTIWCIMSVNSVKQNQCLFQESCGYYMSELSNMHGQSTSYSTYTMWYRSTGAFCPLETELNRHSPIKHPAAIVTTILRSFLILCMPVQSVAF